MAKNSLNIRGKLINLDEPHVMGIINLTPDSFYKGSRAKNELESLKKAEQMLADGATFLDLGGFSTRPGAREVNEADELERVIPIIRSMARELPEAFISIDTFRTSVAEAAIDVGAGLINDITGGADPGMFDLVARSHIPYILMHMRGPVTQMMENTKYDNLIPEMMLYFRIRIKKLTDLGVADIVVDPGFGFSKTLDHNYEILQNLSYFEALGSPLLVGVSRKSMIYKLLENSPEEALVGTSVINYDVLTKGARILRVHDVKEAVDTIKLYKKIRC